MFARSLLGRKTFQSTNSSSLSKINRESRGNYHKNTRSFANSSNAKNISASSSSNALGVAAIVAAFGAGYYLANMNVYAKEEEKKDSKKEEKKEEEEKKALDPKEFKKFELTEVEKYNHNSALYRFKLEDDEILGLDVASCLVVKANIGEGGKAVIRPYTPISSNDDRGHFDLLVKTYENGVMSKHFAELKPGDTLEVKGPISKIPIKPNMKKHIAMIAGGSGITPMYQVANELLKAKDNKTELTLFFFNVTEKDILLRETLDKLASKHSNFKVHYFVDKPEKGWKGHTGFLTPELGKKLLPEPSNDNLVMVCGPPGMMKAYSGEKNKDFTQGEVQGLLKELGYSKDQVFKF